MHIDIYIYIWEKLYPPPTKCSFWFLCLSVPYSKTLTGPTKPTNFEIQFSKTLTGPTKPTKFDIKSTETLTGPTKPTKYSF